MVINESLAFKLKNIPHKPGCYLWKDKYQQVIYVGKARDSLITIIFLFFIF